MEDCLLFRVLRLRWMACPTCQRDVLWRRRNPRPTRCRWCGGLLLDCAAMARSVMSMVAALRPIVVAAQQAAQAIEKFNEAFPPDWNPLDSAVRLRRLPSDPHPSEENH